MRSIVDRPMPVSKSKGLIGSLAGHPWHVGGERLGSCFGQLLSDFGQTGLAVGTVRRAIDVLAQERLVRTVPGRGTFVIAARF
jgi:Bacterial regulatory proteins, gntR family